jgi:hypothetical protein
MLDAFKRFLAGGTSGGGPRAVAAWVVTRGARLVRTSDALVIDGAMGSHAWRLEWGMPQRGYIHGNELRLRMELGLSPELHMLLLSRPLMVELERRTFENFTSTKETQIDASTPEEMRWLAMFPKVALAANLDFRHRFAVVSSSPQAAVAWIAGPVAERLSSAARGPLAGEPPFLVMTLRGRIYLRLELAALDLATFDAMVDLFETAANRALVVNGGPGDSTPWPDSKSTVWQTQILPEDRKR